MENIEFGPWRMGYVMNDFDRILRVMIPSGQLYYLRPETVVFFNKFNHSMSEVVNDEECVVRDLDHHYRDDDWDISEDYEEEGVDNSKITLFVKDMAYPLDERKQKRKHTTSDGDTFGVAFKRSVKKVDSPSRGGWATTWENRQPPRGRTWKERLQPRHAGEKTVMGDCKGADELCGRV